MACRSRAIADTDSTLSLASANSEKEVLSFSIPVQQPTFPQNFVEQAALNKQDSSTIQISSIEINPSSTLQTEVLTFLISDPWQKLPRKVVDPVEQVVMDDQKLQEIRIKNSIRINLISKLNGEQVRQETNPRIINRWEQQSEIFRDTTPDSSFSILFSNEVLNEIKKDENGEIDLASIECKSENVLESENTICKIRDTLLAIYNDEGFIHHAPALLRLQDDQLTLSMLEMQVSGYSYRLLDGEGKPLGNPEDPFDDYEKFLAESIICDRIEHIIGKVGDPVNIKQINEGFSYWKTESLINNIEATFKEKRGQDGKGCGESIQIDSDDSARHHLALDIIVSAKSPQQGGVTFDNNAPASVGDKKFGVSYSNNNLSNLGDRLNIGYTETTTGGIKAANFNYQLPIGVKGNSISLNFSPSWTRVTQAPFNKFDITARNQALGIEYNHALIRRTDEELALSLGFEFQNGRTFIFNNVPTSFGNGANDEGLTRTSTFTFGQQYIKRTPYGGWGLSSKFYFGTGLFNATANRWNEDGGIFSKWEGSLQRIQRIDDKHTFGVNLQWQLTPRTLASSQQFSLGGMNSIRGYRANARTADNGIRLSLEDQITFIDDEVGDPKIQIVPFIDLGWVWNDPDTSNGLSDQRFLFSSGISIRDYDFLGLDNLFFRLDLAYPFIKLKDRGNTLQDKGVYFLLGYTTN
ncbi:MAG: ShlB/FhaC/HecB family hemolysin secretion/activation protein [Limnothrix sp. RL_2_0]|nr:ShlB/FhaC/HecB family hemolysin secretion/activation protein [Limnothrix sp. RL_2_0]